MKERMNYIFGIILFTILLLFSILVVYILTKTNTYSTKLWLLICLSALAMGFMAYCFGAYPFIKEVDYRILKVEKILKLIKDDFSFLGNDKKTFEGQTKIIENKIMEYKEGKIQPTDDFVQQFTDIIAKNIVLMYNIAKGKNEREIEGLAKSLLEMLNVSMYSSRIFVPLFYEIMCFENILFSCIYSEKSNFEIVIDIKDEKIKNSLVLHGILSSIAKIFIECDGKPRPIKNIIQVSAISFSHNLNIRIYYNNVLENFKSNLHMLEALKQHISLYYANDTYRVDFSEGDNHFVIEISIPYIGENQNNG